ncbi:ferritin-like domain-containing protein [Rhodospirillaceae bacterium KN72]|uniref:Ferritin-like domain-containing protein n=1 Tax=Pacificispira spongiicola TaxID=2729598 RepID=A0A7Y0E3E8_9PROT|nr:ferritin-like domain-containing protein [Pacificispira spongiicola]NMM46532.1 ferritin-like domain-containing protein [Pacificispira spongiicola]
MPASWTLDDIDWNAFDPDRVDPRLVRIAKAAALVEFNGSTYTKYLHNVFAGDPDFQEKATQWGVEEVRHGEALAKWAHMADSSFDFQHAFKRFTDGYAVPVDVEASVRGSCAGELIARCIVETGTSTFYTALSKACDEPVLKQISRNIAADEFRHYRLFYDTMRPYLEKENVGRLARLKVGVGRFTEVADDELSYAFYAANVDESVPYDRKACADAYFAQVYPYMDREILRRGSSMILKAVGVKPNGWINRVVTNGVYWFVDKRARATQQQEAA